MKVLQLCHRIPFPANDGGNIAMLSLADSLLSGGVHLKMLTLNTLKHKVELSAISSATLDKYKIESVEVDTSIKVGDAFANLFSSESYNVVRFYSEAFSEKLAQVLKEFMPDIVLLESVFMAPYIETVLQSSKARIVLRAHNAEYVIWERVARNEKMLLKRKYLKLLAKRLKKYEIGALSKVDAVLPITPDDEKLFMQFAAKAKMLVVPVGIDIHSYEDQSHETVDLSLFHLGAMDWRPNLEGIEWFLRDCWTGIHSKFPELNLYLAGRNFPNTIRENAPENVICEGEIMDAKKYMSGKQIMVVPLKSGGGMRVKIIQGMALGKTIISTTIGAEGINYTNGKNLLIADTPEEFLSQVSKCLDDKPFCLSIGNEARQLAATHYSNEMIGKSVMDFLEKLA